MAVDPIESRRWWRVTIRQRTREATTYIHAGDATIAGVRALWYLGWSAADAPVTYLATVID